MQLIQALLLGPDERVKRCSGHWAFPVSPVFPIAPQFLPTPRSIAKMKPSGKECVTIRSALAVVSVNPPAEEHDVLRTCLRVGPAVSERLCSRGEVSSSGKILWPFEVSSYRKVRRGRLLLFLKFFCKTMLPHQGYSRPENPKSTDLTLPSSSAPCKTMVS